MLSILEPSITFFMSHDCAIYNSNKNENENQNKRKEKEKGIKTKSIIYNSDIRGCS